MRHDKIFNKVFYHRYISSCTNLQDDNRPMLKIRLTMGKALKIGWQREAAVNSPVKH